jgi:hypothetical protein
MKDITIDVGVCTILTLNLSDINFDEVEKVIFTVKNLPTPTSEAIIEREFTTPQHHQIIVTAEESIRLAKTAEYDFSQVLKKDGIRVKMTDNGKIVLRKAVGDCIED